ncbi:uncharacterized protein PFL1_00934 [Pseudozyma flocculosa PF-1]|uniref:Probable APS3 - AP-3 complex subunit, sigma3 subunit n=1 Tax=Pseudozyma flocculosa TaxID=84751 RepID=A0A5C3FAL2_9BASI|nr:uncharacterized protein PFL1_00934 [Pseudozyma flocculosa PF-1]EPQ31601.1 hypothetical protein PFL1_00934 [Pseudozyma flocculosa PF-1]SPO40715.1 probable APS3 - AP-3 complex subunit, sigma3 subunit [Pseudozyma flocculosa]
MTIRAVLIVNNHGKPRLTKFYSQLPSARQQALIRLIYRLVSKRPDGVCNFLDAPELTPLLPPPSDAVSFSSTSRTAPSSGSGSGSGSGTNTANAARRSTRGETSDRSNQDELRVIYRHYATLYFVFVVDQSESELGILDLIQVFVESLDRCFENVCELDLIFHFDEVHAILCELIQGGLVVETNINEIVSAAQTTSRARKTSAATTPGGGGLASFVPSATSNLSSLTPSSLNLGFPGSPGWGNGGSSSSSSGSGGGGGGGGIAWPKGTFMVDALANLGSQYLGGGSRGRGRYGR